MAHQAGFLRLKGRLGDLSFYHNKQYGYLIRQKGGPDKGQIARSGKFERTRENNAEFGLAVTTGKIIRRAIKGTLGLKGDQVVSQRLTGMLVRMGKTDLSAVRGRRSAVRVFNELSSKEALGSFAFYEGRGLLTTYTGQIRCNLSAGTIVLIPGTHETSIPTSTFFKAPKGATHVRIKAAILVLDFENHSYTSSPIQAVLKNLDEEMVVTEFHSGESYGQTNEPGSPFATGAVSIEFMQERNGELYLLSEGMSLGLVPGSE